MNKNNHNMPITVVALYKFARFGRFSAFQQPLLTLCLEHKIAGTLLLAHEGINGTVAGQKHAIEALVAFLNTIDELGGMEIKYSFAATMPFKRLKVRLKKEIVTMGVEAIDPLQAVGTYVAPQAWNALISDPNTIVIDTRNDYETRVGTFKGALDPQTQQFNQFPQWLDENKEMLQGKKIAMFCTGGIRCEKATALAKTSGFEEVYHLKGGILGYLEHVAEEDSLWEGECFVFDERVSVGHGLTLGNAVLCRACRQPVSEEDQRDEKYELGLSCPRCYDSQTESDHARFKERQKQIMLAKQRGEQHIYSENKKV
jgi:UPF0176 protein